MKLTVNGRQVTVDDAFRDLPREEQEQVVEHIHDGMPSDKPAPSQPAPGPSVYEVGLDDGRTLEVEADGEQSALAGASHFLSQEAAPKAPSGFTAGLAHGALEIPRGLASTAKRFAGIGDGGAGFESQNYVPAQVTGEHGSLSQLPQKIAEAAPGIGVDIAAAATAANTAKKFGLPAKYAALAGLAGGAFSGFTRIAGDRAKSAAVERTGDAAAEPERTDLIRGGGTALAESAVQSLLPARLAPGATKLTSFGTAGALAAAKRYVENIGIGGAGAVAGDATRQAGMSVGTDNGLSMDPSSFPESFVGGAATAGALGIPKLAAETTRSYALRKYGGENTEATKNYATRLEVAGDGGLGNAKRDALAHETVKSDLKNELRTAVAGVRKSTDLAPDVDNALQRAQSGDRLTPKDITLIESGTAAAPDSANAAYLARTLRVAQLAQTTGSHRGDKWSGGISGLVDKNVLPYLNPLRSMTGLAASGLGIHTLGVTTAPVAAGLVGAYGASRIVDSMTGMRSPAKSFVQHFADRQAQLRLPQTPQAPAVASASTASPANTAVGPWGPKPSVVTSVPQVPPGGAPRDAAAAMLGASLLAKAKAKAPPAKAEAEADHTTTAVDRAKALADIASLKANSKPEGDTTGPQSV